MKYRTWRNWKPLSKLALSIPRRTLRRWCEKGQIRAQKLGKIWYVHLPSLLRKNGFDVLADEVEG